MRMDRLRSSNRIERPHAIDIGNMLKSRLRNLGFNLLNLSKDRLEINNFALLTCIFCGGANSANRRLV